MDGARLEDEFSTRRLREFIPRDRTNLAEAQRSYMEQVTKEEVEQVKKEKEEVTRLWRLEGKHRMAEVDTNYGMADIIGPRFFYEEDEETEGMKTKKEMKK